MAEFNLSIPVVKSDPLKGLLTGWAVISADAEGQLVVDSDGDVIPVDELEKAAHEAFVRRGGRGAMGLMHESFGRADLVESMVITKAKRDALGMGPGPEGWLVTVKTEDPAIKALVAAGTHLEFSIRGSADRIPVETPDA